MQVGISFPFLCIHTSKLLETGVPVLMGSKIHLHASQDEIMLSIELNSKTFTLKYWNGKPSYVEYRKCGEVDTWQEPHRLQNKMNGWSRSPWHRPIRHEIGKAGSRLSGYNTRQSVQFCAFSIRSWLSVYITSWKISLPDGISSPCGYCVLWILRLDRIFF